MSTWAVRAPPMLLSSFLTAVLLPGIFAFGPPRERRAVFEEHVAIAQGLYKRDQGDNTTGVKEAFFEQVIDHNDPSLGTFKQRYYYGLAYYKGQGSPIIFFGPGGEGMEDTKFWLHDNYTIEGLMAQRLGGAMVMLEDRYSGSSSPVSSVAETENLKLLTNDQMMRDRVHFAQKVDLPFVAKGEARPDKVPWINSGCSAGGNRAVWTEREYGGTFWATYASSAPVQGIQNFWTYFDAAKAATAKNCTADVEAVVEHLDDIMSHGNASEIQQIKAMFGASDVKATADFMNLLSNGPQQYQDASIRTHGMWEFCDYVENAVNATDPKKLPGPEGVGLEKALAGYARWVKEIFIPGTCASSGPFKGDNNTECFNNLDPKNPIYQGRSTTTSSIYASWQDEWLWCNEAKQDWQTGSPEGTPTMVSRLVNVGYYLKLCSNNFPPGPNGETYGIAKGVTVEDFNARHGGWSDPTSQMKRVFLVNGAVDPWRAESFASLHRPGGILPNSTDIKHYLDPKGNHCTDIFRNAGSIWPEVAAIQQDALDQMEKWVAEFPRSRN